MEFMWIRTCVIDRLLVNKVSFEKGKLLRKVDSSTFIMSILSTFKSDVLYASRDMFISSQLYNLKDYKSCQV